MLAFQVNEKVIEERHPILNADRTIEFPKRK